MDLVSDLEGVKRRTGSEQESLADERGNEGDTDETLKGTKKVAAAAGILRNNSKEPADSTDVKSKEEKPPQPADKT